MVSLQSSSCLTPDPVAAGPFPSALTTMAFVHSRRRRFEVRSCKPTSRGRPSSVKQLRTLRSCELRVLMAHDCRLTGSYHFGNTSPWYWLAVISGLAVRTARPGWSAKVRSRLCGDQPVNINVSVMCGAKVLNEKSVCVRTHRMSSNATHNDLDSRAKSWVSLSSNGARRPS